MCRRGRRLGGPPPPTDCRWDAVALGLGLAGSAAAQTDWRREALFVPREALAGCFDPVRQVALWFGGDDGFSWANISFFSIQLGCNISIGLLAYFGLPWINRHYVPESARGVRAVKAEEGALTLKNQ